MKNDNLQKIMYVYKIAKQSVKKSFIPYPVIPSFRRRNTQEHKSSEKMAYED